MINPNIVPNPSPNLNRQFFELVQKSDDENEKKNFFKGNGKTLTHDLTLTLTLMVNVYF